MGMPVGRAGAARRAVAPAPLARRLSPAPRRLRRAGNGPAVAVHPIDQELPAEHGQLRPTMCHESLPFGAVWIPTPSLGRLSDVNNLFVNHIYSTSGKVRLPPVVRTSPDHN